MVNQQYLQIFSHTFISNVFTQFKPRHALICFIVIWKLFDLELSDFISHRRCLQTKEPVELNTKKPWIISETNTYTHAYYSNLNLCTNSKKENHWSHLTVFSQLRCSKHPVLFSYFKILNPGFRCIQWSCFVDVVG